MNQESQEAPQAITRVAKMANANTFKTTDADRELFERELRDFVPPGAFDAHAHLYDLRLLSPGTPEEEFGGPPEVGYDVMVQSMSKWMGDRVITDALFLPFPTPTIDTRASNQFTAGQVKTRPASRGLMLIRPQDDPAEVEAEIKSAGFAGFKVYHQLAERENTFYADQSEFLPEWAWELAHQHGLWITMHLVQSKALSDPRNHEYVRKHCLQYPNARYVLAHAARGFNAGHTADAIDLLRGLDNVFFDTSAICEPTAFESIIRATGTTRLMYGSDFPVSEMRGRPVSVGDGFFWLYDHNAEWDGWLHGTHNPAGIESLLGLKRACRTMCLNDRDVERIFCDNARQVLGLKPPPTGEGVQALYREAKTLIPGGTQLLSKRPEMFAPDQWPAYYEQAIGCEVIDTDGRRFTDMSYSGILACVLGFADPDVNAAVIRRVHFGSMATQQTADEVELARLLTEIHPWAEMARFARTGGESMAAAVRIARAATGRDKVVICGYHGWHDWYLAANLTDESDDGSNSLGDHLLPGLKPAGVPRALKGTTLTFHYNKLDELDAVLAEHRDSIAAIVMEPTRATPPDPGFLEGVRERAGRIGAKLIFDEISIGWRLCLGGAHLMFGVNPDMAVFAKTISNGYAMAAIIGTRETMQTAQDSFISSAYWTEGIGPAAAVAAVKKMMRLDVPSELARKGKMVKDGWQKLAAKHSVPVKVAGWPQVPSFSFDHPESTALTTLFIARMLDRGFLAAGNCTLTMAHQDHHLESYLEAIDSVFAEIAQAIEKGDIEERIGGPVKHTMFARLTD